MMAVLNAIKPHLVDDWQNAHKWWSVRLTSLGCLFSFVMAVIEGAATAAPLDGIFPRWLFWIIMGLGCISAVCLRIIKQEKLHGGSES